MKEILAVEFWQFTKGFWYCRPKILLAKLDHYGTRGVFNDWFKSFLFSCNQFVSMNGYDSGPTAINCGVPQVSLLGSLLILLDIIDLN